MSRTRSRNSQSWLRSAQRSAHPSRLSNGRRRFLQLSGATLAGTLLSNCARNMGNTASSPTSPTTQGTPAGRGTLHIYAWSTYVDNQDILKEFESKTGIRVIADVYDSNETMLAKMQAGGGSQYSVIYPSDYMVEQMIELGMLSELDYSRLPSLSDLYPQWQSPPYDPGNKHSYPFVWGTTGIVYNREALGELTDWEFLWENKNKLSGRLTLLNDVREVMGMALKSLGYSNSTKNPQEIEAAYKKLAELKPAISSFSTDGWRDQMVVGDLLASHAYSVDGIDVETANPDLKYVIPKSGATVWTDTMVIPKTAPNVDAAYQWMDYMLAPATASRTFGKLKLATPNQKTKALLPTELKNNPALFPPDEVLEKCEVLANVGSAIDIYDRFWTQLTSG